MDMVTEEDPVCMRTNDIYIPSAYCERESEPEVSLVLDLVESCLHMRAFGCVHVLVFVCMRILGCGCVFMYALQC